MQIFLWGFILGKTEGNFKMKQFSRENTIFIVFAKDRQIMERIIKNETICG